MYYNQRGAAWRRRKNFIKAKKQQKIEKIHKCSNFFGDLSLKSLGFYKKQNALDCGNPRCGICGNPRKSKSFKGTKKSKKTIQELKADSFFNSFDI